MYLLDTHVLLWWLSGSSRITKAVEKIIGDPDTIIFVSAVSIWEIVIKKSLGKLTIPKNFFDVLNKEKFEQLTVSFEHASAVASLPSLHHDPFDRLLIAQAKKEKLTLVTGDETILKYKIPCIKI